MATIHFFGKRNCINNRKQKELLKTAGHTVLEYDIMFFNFTADMLRSFFENRPVADWFNYTAPAITAGEIHPQQLGEEDALKAMLTDRLLIRRPLVQTGNTRFCGFDVDRVNNLIGLTAVAGSKTAFNPLLHEDLVTCPRGDNPCYDETGE